MKWRTSLLCLILFVSQAFGTDYHDTAIRPEAVGLSTDRLERIDTVMNRHVEESKIGGAVVLIARRGKIAYFRAFGLADTDRPMRKNTIFSYCLNVQNPSRARQLCCYTRKVGCSFPTGFPSISRSSVTLRSSSCCRRARSSNSSSFRPHAKSLYMICCATRQEFSISLPMNWFPDRKRELITNLYQEAGISDGLCRSDETIGDMVKRLAKMPLCGNPGEVWQYGLSTDVLGYLVEIVSGKKLDEFMRLRIFEPLKMNDTCFYLPEDKFPRVSAAWKTDWHGSLQRMDRGPQRSGKLCLNPSGAYETSGKFLSGGSGVLSTAYDYFRFCQMLLNKGELDGVRILGRKTVELMTATNHIGDLDAAFLHGRGWKFGLGFAIQTDRAYDENTRSVGGIRMGRSLFNTVQHRSERGDDHHLADSDVSFLSSLRTVGQSAGPVELGSD